jgi:hypothetical protein
MQGKGKVVEAHCRLLIRRVTGSILPPDHRRVKKGRCICCVADEAQDVDGGKVNGQPDC